MAVFRIIGTRNSAKVATAACALIAACAGTPELVDKPLRVGSHDQVGSLHVSILGVDNWADYEEALKPKFKMDTANDALKLAVPVTQTYGDKVYSAFAFGLGVGLGQSGSNTASTFSEKAVFDVTRSSVLAQQAETAMDRDVAAPASRAASSSTSTTRNATQSSERTTFKKASDGSDAKFAPLIDLSQRGFDPTVKDAKPSDLEPLLLYDVSKAIYEHVQILNKSVDSAARRHKYRAQFVRLQVSLMPKSNRLPYDAYVNLSFFANCFANSRGSAPTHTADQPATTGMPPIKCDSDYKNISHDASIQPLSHTPVVVPLLVTDNLESTLASRNIEKLRQFQFGLAGVVESIGINSNVNSVNARAQNMSGRAMNSLMTIGRVTDNTLRVRLGAINQGPSGTRMVPRTHNISLIVLVPEETVRVTVAAKSEFVDPDTTETLPSRSLTGREDTERMKVALKYPEYCFASSGKLTADFLKLEMHSFLGNQAEFNKLLGKKGESCKPDVNANAVLHSDDAAHLLRKANYVWSDLVSLIPGSRFNYTAFDVREAPAVAPPPQAAACPRGQTAVLHDDGDAMSSVLSFGRNLPIEKMSAIINFAQCPGLQLAATGSDVDDTGRLRLIFDSGARLGLAARCFAQARIELEGCATPGSSSAANYPILYIAPKAEPVAELQRSTLRLTATQIAAGEHGEASVQIIVGRGTEKVVLLGLHGADLAGVDRTDVVALTPRGPAVVGDGTANLDLRNVSPGKAVRIFLTAPDGKPIGTAFQLPVSRERKPAKTDH